MTENNESGTAAEKNVEAHGAPTNLKKSDFYYDLPEELIAQTPAEPRDSSRLLVYDRKNDRVEHRIFRDIKNYLRAGDVLVINNTKVLPARLYAHTAHGGRVEVLLLKRISSARWEVLVKPGKKCKPGTHLTVNDELSLDVVSVTDSGERIVDFACDGVFEEVLDRAGSMPLPPYIHEKLKDKNRYQTVYAKTDGSAAAPTAGLHFTPALLQEIKDMGVGDCRNSSPRGAGHLPPRKGGRHNRPQDAQRVLRGREGGGRDNQPRQARGQASNRRRHNLGAHFGERRRR